MTIFETLDKFLMNENDWFTLTYNDRAIAFHMETLVENVFLYENLLKLDILDFDINGNSTGMKVFNFTLDMIEEFEADLDKMQLTARMKDNGGILVITVDTKSV